MRISRLTLARNCPETFHLVGLVGGDGKEERQRTDLRPNFQLDQYLLTGT